MDRCYESATIRDADRIASENLGVPGVVLMENAGRGAAEVIFEKFPGARKILILCGPGNNGGDGFVVARHALIRGLAVRVVTTVAPEAYKGDAAVMARAAAGCGISLAQSCGLSDEALRGEIENADVIVDALLGTGTSGAPRGEVGRLIGLCADAHPVVALDIPSGLDPDSGEAAAVAIRADLTATFLAVKKGFSAQGATAYCGEVAVCSIGVPAELVLPA